MELDKSLLDKIENLDNDEFKNKLSDILDALKVNKIKKQRILSNVSQVKESINSLSQSDVDMIVNKLGEERVNDILSIVKNDLGES